MINGHVQIDRFVNWYLGIMYICTQMQILASKSAILSLQIHIIQRWQAIT